MQNDRPELVFFDLFEKSNTHLSAGIELAIYISFTNKNWENYRSNNIILVVARKKYNKEIGKRLPNNLYKLCFLYDEHIL